MRWKPGQGRSENIEDRRGSSAGGLGGLGGLIPGGARAAGSSASSCCVAVGLPGQELRRGRREHERGLGLRRLRHRRHQGHPRPVLAPPAGPPAARTRWTRPTTPTPPRWSSCPSCSTTSRASGTATSPTPARTTQRPSWSCSETACSRAAASPRRRPGPSTAPADSKVYVDLAFFRELSRPLRGARRLRPGLRPGPRAGPPRPERARHQRRGAAPQARSSPTRSTPSRCASSCRPTAWRASGPTRPSSATCSATVTSRRASTPPPPSATTASAWPAAEENCTHGTSDQRVRWFTRATNPATSRPATRSASDEDGALEPTDGTARLEGATGARGRAGPWPGWGIRGRRRLRRPCR